MTIAHRARTRRRVADEGERIMACVCGHTEEDHPRFKECTECDCICYEPDREE